MEADLQLEAVDVLQQRSRQPGPFAGRTAISVEWKGGGLTRCQSMGAWQWLRARRSAMCVDAAASPALAAPAKSSDLQQTLRDALARSVLLGGHTS